jgi:hypothetical protein
MEMSRRGGYFDCALPRLFMDRDEHMMDMYYCI